MLVSRLSEEKLDGLLVTHPANWYYLTGFTGEAGTLVVSRGGTFLVTDGRFTVQARNETSGLRVIQQKPSLLASTGELLKARGARRIGFNPGQLTVAQLKGLRKACGSRCRWIAAGGMVEALRMRKDAAELAQMRKAAILAGEVFGSVVSLLRPGVRESEIAAEIEYQMKKRGASGRSFETIVAFGSRPPVPHARPTGKRLRKNE